MNSREMARRHSPPYTGKFSARPAGRGDFFVLENLRRFLPATPVGAAASTIPRRLGCVLQAWRNLSGPMWSKNQTKPWGGTGRLPPVGPKPR